MRTPLGLLCLCHILRSWGQTQEESTWLSATWNPRLLQWDAVFCELKFGQNLVRPWDNRHTCDPNSESDTLFSVPFSKPLGLETQLHEDLGGWWERECWNQGIAEHGESSAREKRKIFSTVSGTWWALCPYLRSE